MARLDLYVNYEMQASVQLTDAELLLGRDPTCAVQIPEPDVSRRHAVINFENGIHFIENFGANGTRLNGKPLSERQPLQAGDTIFISRYILVYERDDSPSERHAQTVLLRR